MSTLYIRYMTVVMLTITMGAASQAAMAYVGPGTGLSAIGSLLALVVGVTVAIIGFLWYPLKRIFGKKSQEPDQVNDDENS